MNDEILEITKKFHDTYEKLSKEYNYETREDTKVFDINSNNGKLMYATVNEVINPILEENKQLKIQISAREEVCKRLESNWNKLKEGLKFCYEFDYGVLSKDYLECVDNVLDKMQELESEQ